jgi:hypothetical protein
MFVNEFSQSISGEMLEVTTLLRHQCHTARQLPGGSQKKVMIAVRQNLTSRGSGKSVRIEAGLATFHS